MFGIMANNSSCEPMDVDSSANSVSRMDISEENLDFAQVHNDITCKNDRSDTPMRNTPLCVQDQTRIKVYHINKKRDLKLTSTNINVIVSLIVVLCISVVVYQILDVKCYDELNVCDLNEKLQNKLYGQNRAIDVIIRTLNAEAQQKILFFYGGTGVGKTYTVSIMLDNAWNYSNIFHYTMPSFTNTFSTDLMLGLTLCKTAIFVIDDLTDNDLLDIKNHIKTVIDKSIELQKRIIIILVFNCDRSAKGFLRKCDNTFREELFKSFSNVNALKQFVQFNPLTEEHLKKCIEAELGGRQVTEFEYNNILKNFNVSVDGCKSVYKKITFLKHI